MLGARSQQKSQIMASSTPLPEPTDRYLTMDQRGYRPFFKIEKRGQRSSLHLAGSPHSAKTPIIKDILINKRTNLFHSTSQNIKISGGNIYFPPPYSLTQADSIMPNSNRLRGCFSRHCLISFSVIALFTICLLYTSPSPRD